MTTKISNIEDEALDDDFVLVNNKIEPDNDLFKLAELERPMPEAAVQFIGLVTSASCLAPTDLKARMRTLPTLIEAFHKSFEKLRAEAKNDPDRIQSEIFELYSSFFGLVKAILTSAAEIERILVDSDKKLDELAKNLIQPTGSQALEDTLDEFEKNGRAFRQLFDNRLSQADNKFSRNKLDLSNMDREFIDRLEKLKTEFSSMHPSPSNALSLTEWAKYAHILKVGSKLILPLWHVSYLLFFGVAFGASLVGLTEYYSYYKNHNGFVYLNACLTELYALQELSIAMSECARALPSTTAERKLIVNYLSESDELVRRGVLAVIRGTQQHSKEMIGVIEDLNKIDLDQFLI